MNSFPALRRVFLVGLVAFPFAVLVACSQPASHPPIIGDCSGANCIAGGSVSGSGTSGSDASIDSAIDDDSGTVDEGGIDDSGSD